MSDIVIRCEGLSKRYRIGQRERYRALRDTLAEAMRSPLNRLRSRPHGSELQNNSVDNTIWALKDISFDVKRGEVVGVIGRNGAGKSTLLKILSRITKPTGGYARVHGRVGSLLEVGTGFHPELTGRENVYLNGAILGMKRAEINRKFEEIVAFAEVGHFIDTSVKYYSSGMYMRLAFAVAAHLEPEILVVDEVLAVGDAEFQKKCLGKINNVAQEGRTVLFVSHNMAAIRSLCHRGCVLDKGRLLFRGTASESVAYYLDKYSRREISATTTFAKPPGNLWMLSATVLCNGAPSTVMHMGDDLVIEIAFAAEAPIQGLGIGFVLSTSEGDRLLNGNSHYQQGFPPSQPLQQGIVQCSLGAVPLMPGHYYISLWFGDSLCDSHIVEDALSFEVIEKDIWGKGKVPPKISFLWWPTTFRVFRGDGEA